MLSRSSSSNSSKHSSRNSSRRFTSCQYVRWFGPKYGRYFRCPVENRPGMQYCGHLPHLHQVMRMRDLSMPPHRKHDSFCLRPGLVSRASSFTAARIVRWPGNCIARSSLHNAQRFSSFIGSSSTASTSGTLYFRSSKWVGIWSLANPSRPTAATSPYLPCTGPRREDR
jgi:hypothetical protein